VGRVWPEFSLPLANGLGRLVAVKLRTYVEKLASGTISNEEVYRDMGHGALLLESGRDLGSAFLAVTGPRRALLVETGLAPYLAVPHGDMMLAGCFGLLRAYAAREPDVREQIEARLGPPRSIASA
jgi:hypothetical protein